MKVSVTSEAIEEGIPEDPCLCPIALAISYMFPGAHVVVHCSVVWIGNKLYYLPESAIEFIRKYDDGRGAEPLEFELSEAL